MKREIEMKIAVLALLTVLLLSGCETTPASDSQADDPAVQASSTSTPKTADQIALEKVTESLSSTFEADSYKVSGNGKTVTAIAVIPGLEEKISAALAAKTLPDGWKDTVSSMATAAQTFISACKEAGFSDASTVLYIKNNLKNGDIYLTFFNGKQSFSIFDKPSEGDNPNTITLAEFNKIRSGMKYDEAVKIVGGYGEILSEVDIGDPELYTSVIMWEGEGSLGANANVTVQGGKISSKAQFGLE